MLVYDIFVLAVLKNAVQKLTIIWEDVINIQPLHVFNLVVRMILNGMEQYAIHV
jgi:hypothetical protein